MKMFYQTAKSLKYARVFYYDETKNLSSTGTLSIFVKMQSQFQGYSLLFWGKDTIKRISERNEGT